jgi:Leucine-rich repeat (LRR) protein
MAGGSSMMKHLMPMVVVLTLAAGVVAGFAAETKTAAYLPPQAQLRQVMAKLKELNPAFDGRETHRIEEGALTELSFSSADVTDLSPLGTLTDLRKLSCRGTPTKRTLCDLSPLRELQLTELDIRDTAVSDLSPLAKVPLKELRCDVLVVANKEAARLLVDKQMLERINGMPVAEFMQVANVAAAKQLAEQRRAAERATAAFLASISALPPDQQVAVVMAKLRQLNPGFDGKETHRVERGVVTELAFSTANVADILPVGALRSLRRLTLSPWQVNEKGVLADLSPLKGLPLAWLYCQNNPVRDLSPLKGMPLVTLSCGGTQVSDLLPLVGMRLTVLSCNDTAVGSLAPLAGMPLSVLWCNNTKVTDFSPLRSTPLKELRCDFVPDRDASVLREIKSLTKINDTVAGVLWMRLESFGNRPSGK